MQVIMTQGVIFPPPPPRQETPEEREYRKSREERAYRERKDRERQEQERQEYESLKRKSEADKNREGGTSKRSKPDDKTSSSTQIPLKTAEIDVTTEGPALKKPDIHSIIQRPPYSLIQGPARLQSRFPDWCFRGVRFDLDVEPIKKDEMLQHLEVIKKDIDHK